MNPGYAAKALVAALIAFGGVFVVPNAGTWKTTTPGQVEKQP